jgi:hypothetical protein
LRSRHWNLTESQKKDRKRFKGAKMGSKVQVIPNGVTLQEFMAGKSTTAATDAEDMTSADYYADSYGHFGIHGASQILKRY